ncbi:NAD(P)-dependent alcohol dehydrogenase [Roseivirga sp.]|uniref:NAD(P)-dependent alcohol dehydrogenase n=1 Tax=Roseivirga sp. TaxID=1964215 RepID=UPI003B8E927D
MKAAVYTQYGGPEVLSLTNLESSKPKNNELLIKVEATTVTSGDVRLRASDFPALFWLPARLMFGLFKPKKKTLGHEFSGIVEAVGVDVNQFKVGDQVFGTTTMLKHGAYAEYLCVPEKAKHCVLSKAPEGIELKTAAAVPIGAMTALFLLEKAKLKKTHKVLVYGASGSVGTYAVQLAKHKGAEVTGVCSTANIDLVSSLGASKVIDYMKEDYTLDGAVYDIFFDAVGKTPKSKAKSVLKKNGSYVSVNMITSENEEKLLEIVQMVENGVLKPVIDREYSLDQIVEAHRYVDSGRKRGNVIIDISTQQKQ